MFWCFWGSIFWGIISTEAGQEGYDYVVPLGEVSGPLGMGATVVLDKRNGNIWVFAVDPKTFKLVSEYCGHIEEFIRGDGGKEERVREIVMRKMYNCFRCGKRMVF